VNDLTYVSVLPTGLKGVKTMFGTKRISANAMTKKEYENGNWR
jgi:hypothetical protein